MAGVIFFDLPENSYQILSPPGRCRGNQFGHHDILGQGRIRLPVRASRTPLASLGRDTGARAPLFSSHLTVLS